MKMNIQVVFLLTIALMVSSQHHEGQARDVRRRYEETSLGRRPPQARASSGSSMDALLNRIDRTNEDLIRELEKGREEIEEEKQLLRRQIENRRHSSQQIESPFRGRNHQKDRRQGSPTNQRTMNEDNFPIPEFNNENNFERHHYGSRQFNGSGSSRVDGFSIADSSRNAFRSLNSLDVDDLEATMMEDTDYQDEQASKAKSRGSVQQHHVRERDAYTLSKAADNVRYVMANAQCSVPVRRCIDLSVNQTLIGKQYWPRCAIVSRCGSEAGCCYSNNHVCSVAESHVIELYFYYMTHEANSRAGVDKLMFENHTRCECRPKPVPQDLPETNSNNPTIPPPPSNRHYVNNSPQSDSNRAPSRTANSKHSSETNPATSRPKKPSLPSNANSLQRHYRSQHPKELERQKSTELVFNRYEGSPLVSPKSHDIVHSPYASIERKDQETGRSSSSRKSADGNTEELPEPERLQNPRPPCKCPDVYFPSKSSISGACECVCKITSGSCRRLMKGRRFFKPHDNRCISSGKCGQPACKFGRFNMNLKRCPTKREAKRHKFRH